MKNSVTKFLNNYNLCYPVTFLCLCFYTQALKLHTQTTTSENFKLHEVNAGPSGRVA
jgi:hypothetical protein